MNSDWAATEQFSCRRRSANVLSESGGTSWDTEKGYVCIWLGTIFLNGGKYSWNFSDNYPKAMVSFSQISIQFYVTGLGTRNFFNSFLILQEPAMVGMLGIGRVREHSLASRWVSPRFNFEMRRFSHTKQIHVEWPQHFCLAWGFQSEGKALRSANGINFTDRSWVFSNPFRFVAL